MKTNKGAVREIIFAVIAIIVSLTIYRSLGAMVKNMLSNFYVASFAVQMIFAIPVFFAVILLKKTEIYRSDPKKLIAGWPTGVPFLFIYIMVIVRIITEGVKMTAGPLEILLFLVQMFLVGYCEEVLYRGLLQNALHRYFGERTLSSVRIVIFITGILFGATHMTNVLNPDISFATAAAQSVGAAAIGWLMCAIYYRTGKCLWYVIALHAINDALLMIQQGVLGGATETEAITGSIGVGLANFVGPIVLYGLITLFLLRRKKLEPLLQNET